MHTHYSFTKAHSGCPVESGLVEGSIQDDRLEDCCTSPGEDSRGDLAYGGGGLGVKRSGCGSGYI